MRNNLALARKPVLQAAEIYYATIVEIHNDLNGEAVSYTLQLADDNEIIALKAESCLLVPQIDDLVLVTSSLDDEQIFILQILNRVPSAKTLDLGVDGVITGTNLKLEGQREISIDAPEVKLSGIKGSAIFNHSTFVSQWSEIRAKKAVVIIHSIERIFNTVTEKLKNSFRTIEGVEETKANRLRTFVSGRMFFKAKHAVIKAEEAVAIDGKKVHLG
jgi:hypothetical protein